MCQYRHRGEVEVKLYLFMLNLGAGWGWVVNAMPWPPYPREKSPVTYYI